MGSVITSLTDSTPYLDGCAPGAAGAQVTFEGKADEIQPGVAGDLVFVIREAPHQRFTRQGHDLHVTVQVSSLPHAVAISHVQGSCTSVQAQGMGRCILGRRSADCTVTSVLVHARPHLLARVLRVHFHGPMPLLAVA